MASYLDVSGRIDDRRHWYVCGPDRGLAAAAYHELRDILGARASRTVLLDAPAPAELRRLVMAGADPWEDSPPLYVVERAQDVDMSFLMDARPGDLPSLLLAVGAEEIAPESEHRYAHFFRRNSARMVRCSASSDERTVRWVQRRLGCLQEAAESLVLRASGDTWWLASEVRKLAAVGLGESLRANHIPMLAGSVGEGRVVDSLLRGDKRAALDSIPRREQAPAAVSALERTLLGGALLYEAQKNVGWSARLLSGRTGLGPQELGILRPHVGAFDRHATERRLTVLARVSDRAALGERDAWLSIIAAW